jgi:hypothetical protein
MISPSAVADANARFFFMIFFLSMIPAEPGVMAQ